MMRCSYFVGKDVLLSSWFNELMFELKQRGRMRGWGRVHSDQRAAVVFANCKCAYKFDRFVMFEGLPFPPIVWEILRYVMPLCNITDPRLYPTAAHVNYYKDGYASQHLVSYYKIIMELYPMSFWTINIMYAS